MLARPASSWRRAFALVAAAAACLLGVLLPAAPAGAHATLVATDPVDGAVLKASPGTATFTFNERVSLPPSGVQVFDAEGSTVEATATARGSEVAVDLPDELAQGTYVVAWRIVSADGHPVAGSLAFSVGRPSVHVASPEVAGDAGRGVHATLSIASALADGGLLLALGLAIFAAVALPASVRADDARRRLPVIALVAAVVGSVGVVARLPLTVGEQRGLALGEAVTAWSGIAPSAWVSAGLWLAGMWLAVVALRRGRSAGSAGSGAEAPGRWMTGVAVGAGAGAPTLTGHTRTFDPWLLVPTDLLHVLAGSVWLGGLVGLALTLPGVSARVAEAATVLSRWSTLAAGMLAALLASGSLLTWRIGLEGAAEQGSSLAQPGDAPGSLEALLATTYGRELLAKIVLVTLAIALATWNRFVLVPRMADADHAPRVRAAGRLRRAVVAEATLLAAVVTVTGFLVNSSPRPEQVVVPDGRTGVEVAELGADHKVLATLTPGRVGQNVLLVQVQTLAGEPVETPNAPSLRLGSEELDLGIVAAAPVDVGTWRAVVVVPRPGQ